MRATENHVAANVMAMLRPADKSDSGTSSGYPAAGTQYMMEYAFMMTAGKSLPSTPMPIMAPMPLARSA